MGGIVDQGVDTIRPDDNGGLCGGGAFETKGCAENDCKNSDVNNAGSDGIGSSYVVIDNVRLNDYYAEADHSKVGAVVPGNYNCWLPQGPKDPDCCFCKPNVLYPLRPLLSPRTHRLLEFCILWHNYCDFHECFRALYYCSQAIFGALRISKHRFLFAAGIAQGIRATQVGVWCAPIKRARTSHMIICTH